MDKNIALKFPVLDIVKKRTVCKTDIKKQIAKVREESKELTKATTYDEIVFEALDVVQASINLLTMLHTKVDFEFYNAKHIKKLFDRNWDYVGYSTLKIKYDLNQPREVN